MKYISTIISVAALALAGVIFFTQNREISKLKKEMEAGRAGAPGGAGGSGGQSNFKIAYFDLDTLQERYQFMKDVKNEAIDRNNQINQDLVSRDRKNQQQVQVWQQQWQQRGNNMTQAEMEEANQKVKQMQDEFARHKQDLEEGLYKFEEDKRLEIRRQIENFINEYNKGKNYAYIIAYDHANSFIYNKDTLYNITNDLIDGLNASYASYKKTAK